jgi:DNA-binding NarL/FixJ family response regulator
MNIFIAEDHKIVLDGYKLMLKSSKAVKVDKIIDFNQVDEACEYLNKSKQDAIDLGIFDYSMPTSNQYKIQNGVDLSLLFKKHHPNARVIILTSHSTPLLLAQINRLAEPDGIWLKGDVSINSFGRNLAQILKGISVNTANAKKALAHVKSFDKYLDEVDHQILILLNKGIKTKYIPDHINMTISTIDHRKKKIKEVLGLKAADDNQIVVKAQEMGLL